MTEESSSDYLVADVNFARMTDAPLGAGAMMHEEILERRPTASPSEFSVAFDLPLPFVRDMAPADIIKLRNDEADSFERFRFALRQAIKERVASDSTSPRSSTDVAIEISRDVIDPALREISESLTKADSLLRRTGGLTAGLGFAATTVGLLTAAPAVIGPLVAAAIGATKIKKYMSDRAVCGNRTCTSYGARPAGARPRDNLSPASRSPDEQDPC